MDLSSYIERLKTHRAFRDTFIYHRYLPPRDAVYGDSLGFHDPIRNHLKGLGIERLYSHQAEAIHGLRKGNHIVVATPTASGKTAIYNLTIIEFMQKHPEARALYIFPLKALEQDQLKTLRRWVHGLPGHAISADIYDGDTPAGKRKQIKQKVPNILLTNPDMLHRGILAYHPNWEVFLKNLAFVVIDEIHTYRGIFGSHVSQILRRLKRVCARYGASPRFILLSATVSNPDTFGQSLISEPVQVVRTPGTPRAGQHFVFLNPEESPNFLSAKLFVDCIQNGFRTIVFTQARKVTELIHVWVSQLAPELKRKISSYRAGFMPEERRVIERRLTSGDLLGVVSTSALEMGIDIGSLDICILVGYPGTVINTWQRGGRVGRSGRESLIILVGKPDALDQYFMKHPDNLFERSFEAAILDPDNRYIVESHLPCAAAETPISLEDRAYWPHHLTEHLYKLEKDGLLSRTAEGEPVWFATRRNPQLSVNIRSAGETFTIFEKETGQAIGTVDGIRALKECHPGAIYLHRAHQYEIDALFLDQKDVVAHRSTRKYFTRIRSDKETEIIDIHQTRPRRQFVVREGALRVTETVTGYEKRSLPDQSLMGVFSLDLPSQTFETVGFWVEIEDTLKGFVERKKMHFMGGIHAIEHAAIGLFPLFALCDRNDIGGICYPYHPQVEKSAIFIYDACAGGVGLAQRGFDVVVELLERTLTTIRECECEDGCPSCIHSPKCGSGNKPLDKAAALIILEGLLGHLPLSQMSKEVQKDEAAASPVQTNPPLPAVSKAPRVLYLDLETQKTAQEVGGWQNAHLMRISVAVIFDTMADDYRVFEEAGIEELLDHLTRADLIVGFNIKRFDYKVLGAYTEKPLHTLPTFDILEDIFGRLGFRLGLDHLARETLKKGKTADGLQAVEWFRQKEMKKLSRYCRDDVAVTKALFLYGLENHHLIYRKKGTPTPLRLLVDWDLNKLIYGNGNKGT
ncbi:MAG: DEAD/DEAH box helicase [Deltaproteobacteria bacterium]|nr:DEAD/DEAH box helicase [Deltaproteobacteria bacterium]